ncbi:MAG: hypothetical protein JXA60_12005 [Candidatus Coatesbacteria bacterium]|nr:hypothetical protein [Candidatus Coatesbacteria bacterium]
MDQLNKSSTKIQTGGDKISKDQLDELLKHRKELLEKWKKGELKTEQGLKPGTSSTNEHEKTDKEAPDVLKSEKKINKDKSQKIGEYKKMYDSMRTKSKGYATKVEGKVSDKEEITQFKFQGIDDMKTLITDEGELIKDIKRTEEEAIQEKQVPVRYKDLIREYYKSME